ncbi:hypothetical protein BGX21_006209 [Mortierella sp. AD011]|nr:hypothetical protein BGX20_010448 [Mortierella sp. AD010]KAF9403213.1 hypothetical protein BGX21_006209 [Mortierella sp. AD011]
MASTAAPYPSSSPTSVPSTSLGISVQTLLLVTIVGLIGLTIATVCSIHVIRRYRRRGVVERESGQDPESNIGRVTSTYRPEDESDSASPPPQYRAIGRDQPYVDPNMVVAYQDTVFLNNNSALEQASSQQGLIGAPSAMTAGDPNGPIITTATTTATASSMNPIVSNTIVATPPPVATPITGRDQSIIGYDLSGSNNIHNMGIRTPTLPTTAIGVYSTNPNSQSTTEFRSTSSTLSHPEQSLLSVPATTSQNTAIRQSEGNPMTERVGNRRRSSILQPILNRFRSQGPPPYIPMSPEEAVPHLPPEYATAVSQ